MAATIFLAATELHVAEADGTAYVEIHRGGDLGQAVTVTYGVTTDNATAGTDQLVFEPNTFLLR